MSISDLRANARQALHDTLSVPAIYIAPGPGGAETPVQVRVHTRNKALGDLTGFDFGPAERIEPVPEIVSLAADVAPERGGIFSIAAGEAYRVEHVLSPDGITVTSQVSRLSATRASGLSVPGA